MPLVSKRWSNLTLVVGALALAGCGSNSTSGASTGASAGTSTGATSGSSGNGSGTVGSGSASGGGTGESGSADDAGTGADVESTVSTTPGACANPTVKIDFSPMYSAFIPGSTAHSFQIPAVTDDGNPAIWSVSDTTQAQLVQQSFGGLPGVMITVLGVGTGTTAQITVYAVESNGACGSSILNITPSTEDDWTIGNQRYNDGVSIARMANPGGGGFEAGAPRPDGGGGGPGDAGPMRATDAGSFYERDGGTACTNCHGPTATSGPFRDVSHTPEQTGGFSDSDLIGIITQGVIPDGGYFDPSVIIASCDGGPTCTAMAFTLWHSFHQWSDIQSDQYLGIVTYLRSLQPEAQLGSPANFGGGGRGRRDGGVRDASGE
jgi:hypothetical protein